MITPEQQDKINEYLKSTGMPVAGAQPTQTSWFEAVQEKVEPTKKIEPIKEKEFSVKETALDVAKGVGKGALSTLKGIGTIGETVAKQTAGRVASAAQGKGFTVPEVGINPLYTKGTPEEIKAEEFLAPKNTAQKVGKFIEQTAELAVPLTKAGNLTKGLDLTSKIAPKLAPGITKTAINVLPKAVVDGLTTAGLITAQQGEVDDDAIVGGIISGAIPFAGAVGKELAKKMGNNLSSRLVNSLIKPLAKDLSYGKNPGRGVAEEGIIANSLDDLDSKIAERLNVRVGELKNMLLGADKKGIKLNLSNSLKPIDDAIVEAQKAPRTNQAIISRLQAVKDDLLGVTESGSTRNIDSIVPSEAIDFKRLVGKLTKFTGNASDDKEVNSALKKVYGNIKGEVEKVAPETKDLNERIADLISAESATKYREVVNQRQNLVRVGESLAGIGGLAAALSGGMAIVPSMVIGAGAAGVKKVLSTPAAKTRMANWLISVPSKEKAAMLKSAPWLKAALTESLFGDDDTTESSEE